MTTVPLHTDMRERDRERKLAERMNIKQQQDEEQKALAINETQKNEKNNTEQTQ